MEREGTVGMVVDGGGAQGSAPTRDGPGTQIARRPRHKPRLRPGLSRSALHAVVVLFMVVWFTPILELFVSSLRTPAATAQSGWWREFIHPVFTGVNYQQAMSVVGVGGGITTSLAISVPVTVLTTFISAIGAYALTRQSFRGRTTLSLLLVAMLVVPPQVTLVPMLKVFNHIGLSGKVPAVWVYQVGFTVPFGIFLLRGFMASIPEELFESASLDGASNLRTFRSVVVPLSAAVLAALALLQFVWSWNDLLIPLVFLGGTSMTQPITVLVAGLAQSNGSGQGLQMAAAFVAVAIPLVIVVSLQRYFVRGILGGAVKG